MYYKNGNLILNIYKGTVRVGDKNLNLSMRQYQLLTLLMVNINKVISHEEIFETIWGFGFDLHVIYKAKKILNDRLKFYHSDAKIESVSGWGYLMRDVNATN